MQIAFEFKEMDIVSINTDAYKQEGLHHGQKGTVLVNGFILH